FASSSAAACAFLYLVASSSGATSGLAGLGVFLAFLPGLEFLPGFGGWSSVAGASPGVLSAAGVSAAGFSGAGVSDTGLSAGFGFSDSGFSASGFFLGGGGVLLPSASGVSAPGSATSAAFGLGRGFGFGFTTGTGVGAGVGAGVAFPPKMRPITLRFGAGV